MDFREKRIDWPDGAPTIAFAASGENLQSHGPRFPRPKFCWAHPLCRLAEDLEPGGAAPGTPEAPVRWQAKWQRLVSAEPMTGSPKLASVQAPRLPGWCRGAMLLGHR